MFMQFLIERARRISRGRGYSPLILRRSELSSIQISELLDIGTNKISDIWKQLGAEAVEMEDLIRFTNLNTSTDFEEYRKLGLEKI